MEEKTTVWIPIKLHSILKHKAIDKRSTIEKELIKILQKELNKQIKEKPKVEEEIFDDDK